ncbi:MAG TPA: phospholipid carrier-dependent glycosyltransferase, partial [Acidimicrobiia bacterium]|nr:phospholipid carrier-dependent glycosyltransferase [Acidimicrobiia bacterium]
ARRNPGLFRHDVYQDGVDTHYVRRLRLPSVGLGLAAVLLTAVVAGLVSRDRWTPVVAAAICALVPKFVFVSGTVNNDNLANALGALVCVAAVYAATRPGPARRPIAWSVLLGVLVGALVLTKLSALPLVAGVALATVFMVRNGRDGLGALRLAGAFAANAAAALVVSGWWLVRNVDWYGDPFASDATHDHFVEVLPGLVVGAGASFDRAFVELPRELWRTFWYSSGWNQLRWDEWSYLPFWLLLAVALFGIARRSRSDPTDDEAQNVSRGLWVLGALALGAVASYWIIGFETTGGEARVMFAGLPAIATLAALGLQRLRVPVLARFTLPAIGVAGVAVALDNHLFGYYGG